VVQSGKTNRAAHDHQEDEMPARKTKGPAAADPGTELRAEELAAADSAAAASVVETAEGAADVTRADDEAAASASYSALSDAAAKRGSRDAAQGAATLSMADEVAAGGAVAAALSSDEFRRGMELAGIAGQVQVAAELLGGVGQPTLAAFLASTCASWQPTRSAGPLTAPSLPMERSTSLVSSRPWDSPRWVRGGTNTRHLQRLGLRALRWPRQQCGLRRRGPRNLPLRRRWAA
jgi:hypothetical protein